MDLATVALVVSITNGLAALTLTLIKLNDRRRIRTRSRTTDTSSVPDDAGASDLVGLWRRRVRPR
jgi:hypothetical protein